MRESDDLARALRSASDAAYRAVRTPVEGTMLTAIRELAEEAERGGSLAEVVARGDDCVVRTQAMLPVLTEAGVVDAGAAGLVEILRGLAAAIAGEPLPERPPEVAWRLDEEAIHQELSRYRYCTVFLVEGEGLDADALEAELEPLGDSLFVVGDPSALKVHVHTDDPGRALSLGIARGTVAGVEIANMHEQMREREERLLHAVPASAPQRTRRDRGRGRRGQPAALREPRRAVVDGGRTMNPSTAELLAAVEADPAPEVVILPNDRNVLHGRRARGRARVEAGAVVPTRVAAGRAGGDGRVRPGRSAEENAAAMLDAADDWSRPARSRSPRATSRRTASPSARARGSGSPTGEPVAGGGSFDEVARAVLDRLLAEPRERAHAAHRRGAAGARRAARRARGAPSGPRARGARRRPAALRPPDLGRVAALPRA